MFFPHLLSGYQDTEFRLLRHVRTLHNLQATTIPPNRQDLKALYGPPSRLHSILLVPSVYGADLVRGQRTPSVPDVDHLIWGVADLEAGIDHLERLTGVRAAVGGSHPNRGTRNGILALGTRQYIEILAPDPQQPHTATPRVTLLKQLQTPRLMTWCALGQEDRKSVV